MKRVSAKTTSIQHRGEGSSVARETVATSSSGRRVAGRPWHRVRALPSAHLQRLRLQPGVSGAGRAGQRAKRVENRVAGASSVEMVRAFEVLGFPWRFLSKFVVI